MTFGESRKRPHVGGPYTIYNTDLESLDRFVYGILRECEGLKTAEAFVEERIFFPRNLAAMLERHRLIGEPMAGSHFRADNRAECYELLTACLGDWIDFRFTVDPPVFAIRADHDQYCWVYARKQPTLDRIAKRMRGLGYRPMPDPYRD